VKRIDFFRGLGLSPAALIPGRETLTAVGGASSVRSFGAMGDRTIQTAEIQAAIDAAQAYSTVVIEAGEYVIERVTITKPLRVVCWGARIILSGNNAGFVVEGTVPWFRVEGGHITGDNTNRDDAPSTAQVGWLFGNSAGANVSDVEVSSVKVQQANVGFKFAAGVSPDSPVERVKVLNCDVTGSVGTVGGVGYGVQFTQTPGSSIVGGFIEGCGRHGLYFSEGENYNATGVHIENCGRNDGTIRGALTVSRSANVSIVGCNFHDNKDAAIVVDVDTQGGTPNILDGVTISGCTLSDNKYGDLVVGTVAPARDGVPKTVTFAANTIVSLAAMTSSSILIHGGSRIRITDNNIDGSKVTGTLRVITLDAADAASHTDDVTISRNSIDVASRGFGIQVASSLCTGSTRMRFLDNEIRAATAEFEFLAGEANITNNDLRYNRSDGVCRRTNSDTGGSSRRGITVPVGGVDVLVLDAADSTFIEDFSGSYEGQQLTIHFMTDNVRINNNTISTARGRDIKGAADDVIVLVRSDGAWRQQSPVSEN